MKKYLEISEVYHAYQRLGGFFGARLRAFEAYVDFNKVKRVFDIGCGPGHISQYIPKHIEYIGFDTEQRYIDYANRKFGSRGRFFTRLFDGTAADDFGKPDLILLNGVLHHMNDATAVAVVKSAAEALPDSGVFFALDGCYESGQNAIAKHLLDNDRGEFVRTAAAYREIVGSAFENSDVHVRSDLSWVPYTFAITRGSKSPLSDHG